MQREHLRQALALGCAGVVALPMLVGCQRDRRLERDTASRTVNATQLDVDDALRASAELSDDLLASPAFPGPAADGRPPLIAVSTFANRTDQRLDPDLILKSVRVRLTNSGVARVRGNLDEDREARAVRDARVRRQREEVFLRGLDTGEVMRDVGPAEPGYTLTLKLLDRRSRDLDTRELTYVFQMTLLRTRDSAAVWEGESLVTKQRWSPLGL